MSSSDSIISSLISLQKNIYRFGGPFLMILGSTSCVLMVFIQKNLRQDPCSIFNTSSLWLISASVKRVLVTSSLALIRQCSTCCFAFVCISFVTFLRSYYSLVIKSILLYQLLLEISIFTTYIPFCIGCYTSILASKTFRHEIRSILWLLSILILCFSHW